MGFGLMEDIVACGGTLTCPICTETNIYNILCVPNYYG